MRDPRGKAVAAPKDPKEEELQKTKADLQKAENELRLEEAQSAADLKTMLVQVDTLKVENDRLKEQLGKVIEVKRPKQVQKEYRKPLRSRRRIGPHHSAGEGRARAKARRHDPA